MGNSQHILDITAVAVRVPRRADLLPKTAHGEVLASEYALIQVTTDAGIRGIGEATTAPSWNGEEAQGSVELVNRLLRPHLLGLDVGDWARIGQTYDGFVKQRPFLRAGLEMACLDADARARGVRVVDLLGGPRQTLMENKIVLPARGTETVAAMAELALARGAERLKVKVGTGMHGDLERIRAVRTLHLGALSVDANEGWDPAERDDIVDAVQRHDLACVEQPFPRAAQAAARALQSAIAPPLLADESVWCDADIDDIAEHGSFRAVSLYPGKLGGLRRFVNAARNAHRRGLIVVVGSNLELGVGTAAMVHALAATDEHATGIGHDLIGPLYFEHSMLEDDGFVGYDGTRLPEDPGLGVRVDTEALARFALPFPTVTGLEAWA